MRNDNNAEATSALAVVMVVALVISGGIWSFSEKIGVTFSAGLSLLGWVVAACALLGLGWWQQTNHTGILSVRAVAPAALAFVWWGFGPAMQQWGAIGPMFPGMTEDTRPVEWWAGAWTRWLVLLAILGGGYYLLFRDSRY